MGNLLRGKFGYTYKLNQGVSALIGRCRRDAWLSACRLCRRW